MEYLTVFNIGIILALVSFAHSLINYICASKICKKTLSFWNCTTLIYPIIFWFLTSHFQTQGAILSPIVSHLIIYPFWIYFNFKRTYLRVENFSKNFSNGFPVILILIFVLINNSLNKVTILIRLSKYSFHLFYLP